MLSKLFWPEHIVRNNCYAVTWFISVCSSQTYAHTNIHRVPPEDHICLDLACLGTYIPVPSAQITFPTLFSHCLICLDDVYSSHMFLPYHWRPQSVSKCCGSILEKSQGKTVHSFVVRLNKQVKSSGFLNIILIRKNRDTIDYYFN